jgi:O-antigen/teichoic acid export membrane protein
VLSAALIVALVLAGAHLLAFLTVTIPVGIVVLALNAWVVRGRIPLRPAFSGSAWWRVLRNVLPYSAAVAAGTLYIYMAVVIVSLLASKHAIGYFGVSSRVIQVLLALPQILIGAAFPIFARAARDDRVRLAYAIGRVFEASLLFGVLISLGLAIGASVVIDVVGGSEYAPAAAILAIQGVGVAASFAGAVWSNGLLSLGRYRDILAIYVLALLVGGVLIALLVSIDGAHGAAIATATDELILALLSGYALARADRTLTPPLRILPAVILAAGLAAASTLLALPVLASVTVASVIYVGTLLVTGAIPQELREQLRRRPRVQG